MQRSIMRFAADAASLRLYQYRICPFCNKVKATLDFLQRPYQPMEVNPLTRSQIKFSKDYKKVPIAVFNDSEVVGDSSKIVDRILAEPEAFKRTGLDLEHFQSADARHWADWVDRSFAVCVYPNITRSVGECWKALGYLHSAPGFSSLSAFGIQAVGSVGMSMAHGKIKKKYGMTDERAALYERVEEWSDAVGKGPFRGGAVPDLSDLAVYGCIRGLGTLPIREELLQHGRFGPWLQRMEAELGPVTA